MGSRTLTAALMFGLVTALAVGEPQSSEKLAVKERFLEGHQSSIGAVAISHDGKLAASVDASSNNVHLWSFPDGKKTRILQAPGSAQRSALCGIRFAPADDELAVGLNDRLFQWNLTRPVAPTETNLTTAEEKDVLQYFVYDNGGTNIGMVVGNRLLRLERRTGNVFKLKLIPQRMRNLALQQDFNVAVGVRANGLDLTVWRLEKKDAGISLRGHVDRIWAFEVLQDGLVATAGCADRRLILWDLRNMKQLWTMHTLEDVSTIAWNKKENLMAVGTYGGGIELVDSRLGKRIKVLKAGDSISQ